MSGLNPEQWRQLTKWAPRGRDPREGLNLGYFDTAVNRHFRTLDDGSRVFYVQGEFGRRGYVVPPGAEPALRARARSLSQTMCIASMGIGLALARWIGDLDVLGLCVLLASIWASGWLVMRLAFWPLTRKMERATVPNSPVAYWKSMGQTLSPVLLVLFAVFALALLAIACWICAQGNDLRGLVISLLLAWLMVPFAVAIWCRWRRAEGAAREGDPSH